MLIIVQHLTETVKGVGTLSVLINSLDVKESRELFLKTNGIVFLLCFIYTRFEI